MNGEFFIFQHDAGHAHTARETIKIHLFALNFAKCSPILNVFYRQIQ